MNLQTVDDLIADLQRLPAYTRRQPVNLGVRASDVGDATVRVVPEGNEVRLYQRVDEIGDGPSVKVTCPECHESFWIDAHGQTL